MRARYLIMISILVLLLQSVCLAQGLSSTRQQCSDLDQIAQAFYQAKSQQEILDAWKCYVQNNPRINVDATLSSLQQKVKKIGEDKIQRSRTKVSPSKNYEIAARNEYQQAIQTIANLANAMHNNAMAIINNLKQ